MSKKIIAIKPLVVLILVLRERKSEEFGETPNVVYMKYHMFELRGKDFIEERPLR